eukprot:2091450-Pyramimonas_sp.AAC.1
MPVGKKLREKHVRRVQLPLAALAGRGLAVRIAKRFHDFTFIGAYAPPRPSCAKSASTYEKTVSKLFGWISD